MRRSPRGVSPVVGVALLVAVVVVLSATTSVFVLGLSERTNDPAPAIGQSSGELLADRPGADDQTIRLTHVAGDPIDVSEIEIVVDATDACGEQSRIVDMPSATLGSQNYEGADIFDYFSPDGGQLDASADGTWSAGETASFRLASTECTISEGEVIEVQVVHVPSASVVIDVSLTAT